MRIVHVAALTCAGLVAAALPATAAHDTVPSKRVASFSYSLDQVQADAVPGSQAWGSTRVKALPNGKLQVTVEAGGLTPGVHHMAHLHGFTGQADGGCPGADRDTDLDGLISVGEGVPDFGPVLVHLTTTGATTGVIDHLAYPMADADGTIRFQRTFPASEQNHAMAGRVQVVVHGIDLDMDGALDAGMETSIPVVCGGIAN